MAGCVDMCSFKWRLAGLLALLFGLGGGLLLANSGPHNPVGYVLRVATTQARLLWGRVPLSEATDLSAQRRENLARIPRIKAFAQDQLGLVAHGTYDTIHPTWDRVVWNVSGCRPLSFKPKKYWFPFVGTVPYIGYFERAQADARAEALTAEGFEVWVRPAGAYSTLGWFDDPVLPTMLDWSERRLADTVIHEIVHANVWIKGSAKFNESLANFVGQKGAIGWLVHAYGEDSAPHRKALEDKEDADRWRALLAGLCAELLAVFDDPGLTDGEKLARKYDIMQTLPLRLAAGDFHDAGHFKADPAAWNNARLLQFRTYNSGFAPFEALWAGEGGDTSAFLRRVKAITAQGGDPFEALTAATGVSDF